MTATRANFKSLLLLKKLHLSPGLSEKAGQCKPVAAKTSALGMSLVLMSNTVHERG